MGAPMETPCQVESNNGTESLNSGGTASPKDSNIDGKGQKQECNGTFLSTDGGKLAGNEQQAPTKVTSKPTGAV